MQMFFKIHVDNVVDIITNSSSELFVLEGKTKEIVEEMISSVYPDYRSEYEELVSLKEMDDSQFDNYLSYAYNTYTYNYDGPNEYHAIEGIQPEELYSNWNEKDTEKYFWPKFSDQAIEKLKNIIDPDGKVYFLYSIDENPNWEMQEKLMCIGQRYHLG